MTATRVSIAMATYNGARFIGAQLASFAAQTVVPDELVITDDGSSDDTLAIIEAFAATAPFAVEVHRNPARLGYARNFEKAIGLCGGEIIFLSDQDDVWLENKIAVVLGCFEANPESMVVINDSLITDGNLNWFGRTQMTSIESAHIPLSTFVQGCSSAHRAQWRDIALPLPEGVEPLTHDGWINGLAFEMGVVTMCRQPLQYFRRHQDNASAWILSRPRGSSTLKALILHLRNDPRASWKRRLDLLDAMLALMYRIGQDEMPPVIEHRFSDVVQDLSLKRDRLSQRIALCATPRLRRGPAVFKFWKAGGYSDSSRSRGALMAVHALMVRRCET